MAGERDPYGAPTITTGFIGGFYDRQRVGTPLVERLNPGDPMDRMKVFYKGVAKAGDIVTSNAGYWRNGGGMDSLIQEFEIAAESAAQIGVITPRDVLSRYEERIVSYMSCMGLASGITHCDGSMASLVQKVPDPEHIDRGWNSQKSKMMIDDPAINFPLHYIRYFAETGALPYYWSQSKRLKTKTPIDTALTNTARLLENDRAWQAAKVYYHIPDGLESSLTQIAYSYYIVEDLPVLQERLKNGQTHFADTRVVDPHGRDLLGTDPNKSDCGILPFDNVYYSTFSDPTGILRAKGIFYNHPQIINGLKDFFTYSDTHFGERLSDKLASQISVKDMDRWTRVWDLVVGGSQGTSLADFSKFGEAIFALCNLYNLNDDLDFTKRSDVVGYMVGEAFYIKTLALMQGVPEDEKWQQLFRILSVDPLDTPDERSRVVGGVLGSRGEGTFGVIATAVEQFGLHVGTDHYNQAVAMLKTGIKDPKLAIPGQVAMAGMAGLNRLGFLNNNSGKKKK